MPVLRLLFVLVLLSLAACRDKASASTSSTPDASAPVVTDGATGLMLTWIDDKGGFHTELKVTDVPAEGRSFVRVRDPAREPTPDTAFVADLRTAGEGGRYPVRAVPADDFEKVAVERRKAHGTILAAASAAPSAVPAEPSVVIYGAEWCGPCHQLQAYLRGKGVPFVEKDIDKDPVAASEMRRKLAKVGRPAGSIPVVDIRGRILVGFDPRQVDEALGRAM